ncbi:MAG TPA: flagellar motor switch protein FliN [Planctomycetota bacterium]|nr:flagellar motor switch protein FliN [Planctomycetota bacterium]
MSDPQSQEEIDRLMRELQAASSPPPAPAAPAHPLPLEPLSPAPAPHAGEAGLDLLQDVRVNLRVELGSARMQVQDILRLGAGSVVPLESLAGDPVNLYVNDRLVARGEILVVNDNFAVRVLELVSENRA